MTSLLQYSTDLPALTLPDTVDICQGWYHFVHQYLERPMVGHIEISLFLVPSTTTLPLDALFVSYRDWKIDNDPYLTSIFSEENICSAPYPHVFQLCIELVEHKIYQEFQAYLHAVASSQQPLNDL